MLLLITIFAGTLFMVAAFVYLARDAGPKLHVSRLLHDVEPPLRGRR